MEKLRSILSKTARWIKHYSSKSHVCTICNIKLAIQKPRILPLSVVREEQYKLQMGVIIAVMKNV